MSTATTVQRGRLTLQCLDPASGATLLRDQREAQLTAVTEVLPDPPCVDIYVMAAPGKESGARAEQAVQAADARGWHIGLTICETAAEGTNPVRRPQLSRLLDRIARGESDGITAVSRTDFSPFDDEYEALLNHLRDLGGFLVLASPETDL
ncbi:recombinase family protein [Streptomyces sp. NPDC001502]|uniref:recombinase family protein n=1 Tax=Streptomyces sp. NPDC001502 TaxID=3364578 RepID=UPI0036A742A9